MSMQALRERLSATNKSANQLLAEKGSQTWSKEDQAKFDGLMEEAERLQSQIEAHQKVLDLEAGKAFKDVPRNQPGEKTEARKGVELFLRKHSKDLSQEEAALIRNTMSTTTGSEGGYTVQTEIASTVIQAMKDFGAMRKLASNIVTTQGNDLSYPTSDGTAEEGEIVAQNVAAADGDIAFGTVPLNVFKFGSKVITIPIELLQDTNVDIVALLNQRIRERIGRIGNRMFTTGTGVAQPNGLITAAGVGRVGAGGQVATVIYDDLIELVDSLDVAYQTEKCGFQFAQSMRRVIRKLKDTAGRPIWTPSYDEGASAKTPDLLLGYPVEINNHVAAPAANAKSIAFGDTSKYMIRDAMQVTLFRFEDSAFLKKGQVGFLAWARMGGNLLDVNAVKTYQHPAA
jgi:HK97 family phage major capsid protein